jgi:hypothetical protein
LTGASLDCLIKNEDGVESSRRCPFVNTWARFCHRTRADVASYRKSRMRPESQATNVPQISTLPRITPVLRHEPLMAWQDGNVVTVAQT